MTFKKKVQCRSYTCKGHRCKNLTSDQREYKGDLYPCCRLHKQWWWERIGSYRPKKIKVVDISEYIFGERK